MNIVNKRTKMINLSELELIVAKFDEKVKPIARRSFDFNDPDWIAKLAKTPDPLDETGIRSEMETLLSEVTDHYANCDHETRRVIRSIFEKYNSVAWAATFSHAPTTSDGIRRQLLLFSILDQGRDTRDAILALQDISSRAKSAGIQVKPILEEIACFSSEINKYGMGSTKSLLLNAC
jgi:hypothetical protein